MVLGGITRMNKRFIMTMTLRLTLLDWILFFVLFFCLDNHSLGDPPPGFMGLLIGHILQVLAFPMTLVVTWLGKDPPYFFLSVSILFLLGGFVWAFVLERLRYFFHHTTR